MYKENSEWSEGRGCICLTIDGQLRGIRMITAEVFRWWGGMWPDPSELAHRREIWWLPVPEFLCRVDFRIQYDWKEVLRNFCLRLRNTLDCKEIQPVHPKGDRSWVFIGRTDAEAVTPILWPPDAKSWLIGKDPNAGRVWGQEENRMTENEMAGWHHWLNAHESGWTPGVGDGQGGLPCCDSWGRKESDMTEWLNWTELKETNSLYTTN